MQWVRMILEVITNALVKLLDREDTVLTDPAPVLDSIESPDLDDLLGRYDGLLD